MTRRWEASALAGVERLILLREWPPRLPPLFILGLPRSGTTLVYQYLVHRLELAYFTNGVGRFPGAPCLVSGYQRIRHGDYHSDFRSEYGVVAGPNAPREAGSFWGTYFDLEEYSVAVRGGSLAESRLRSTVGLVERMFGGRHFVNKNVKHMLWLPALARIFPEARFLVVHRNLLDVGLSLLEGRRRFAPERDGWWSVRPPGYRNLSALPLSDQIAAQVLGLDSKLRADTGRLAGERTLSVEYEAFCRDPEELVEIVCASLGTTGFRNPAAGPFPVVHRRPRSDEEERVVTLIEGPFRGTLEP